VSGGFSYSAAQYSTSETFSASRRCQSLTLEKPTENRMYRRGPTVRVLWREDDQWRDAVFLEYISSKCRVLWEEVEPGQSPTALC
jgi:hypothetical protein